MAQLAPPVSRTDAALNVGRELFHPDDDKGFGKWKNEILLSQLGRVKPKADDEIAAMWAASNPVRNIPQGLTDSALSWIVSVGVENPDCDSRNT